MEATWSPVDLSRPGVSLTLLAHKETGTELLVVFVQNGRGRRVCCVPAAQSRSLQLNSMYVSESGPPLCFSMFPRMFR